MFLKKAITLLGSLGMVAIGSTSVVSCIAPAYANGENGQRVVLATDGGKINDHSFNEDAYAGITDFLKDTYNLSSNTSYVEARDGGTDSIKSGYRLAALKGANTIVMPGFSHLNTLPQSLEFLQKQNIVLVDAVVKADNVVSLQFNSQISGVMAGFDTSYWATTKDDKGRMRGDINGDNQIKIGTFAGASSKYGVDNYMWGLLLGMQIYNDMASGGMLQGHTDNDQLVKTANTSSGNVEDVNVSTTADKQFFTGGFALGGATQSGILGRLIDTNKADIMFPVAGPQIEDVINYKTPTYLIGVDVDQAEAYSDAAKKGLFITSAIKNIHTAVPEALVRAESDTRKNTLIDPKTDKPFTAGKGSNEELGENDKWLSKQPDPFLNWSIDYTAKTRPDSGYNLKQNYLDLYDPNNTEISATPGMAIYDINYFYGTQLGPTSPDYMQGKPIVKLAKALVEKYGATMHTEDGNKQQSVDWATTSTNVDPILNK